MKPVEKSREKYSCSAKDCRTYPAVALSWFTPQFPSAPRTRKLRSLRTPRHQVDHAADGIRTVHGRTRPLQDLDPLHGVERHRHVEIMVPGLRVIQAQAVEQDQRLAEGCSPDRHVALHQVGRPLPEIERRIQPEKIRQ